MDTNVMFISKNIHCLKGDFFPNDPEINELF